MEKPRACIYLTLALYLNQEGGRSMDELPFVVDFTSTDTLNFFFQFLRDDVRGILPQDQVIYTASVLAHYAQTSCQTTSDHHLPTPQNLSETHDRYVLGRVLFESTDAELLEFAGAEILLLAGFFRDQMARRHNLPYFEGLGQKFYARASCHSPTQKQRQLLGDMARNFPVWTQICRRLNHSMRDARYLLPPLSS